MFDDLWQLPNETIDSDDCSSENIHKIESDEDSKSKDDSVDPNDILTKIQALASSEEEFDFDDQRESALTTTEMYRVSNRES